MYIFLPLGPYQKDHIKKKKRFNFFPLQIGVVSKLMVTWERCMADPILKVLSRDSVQKLLPDDTQETNLLRSFKQKGRYFIYNITNKSFLLHFKFPFVR